MGNTKQKTGHCRVCNKQVLAVGTTPSHGLHLFLTIITAGLWGLFVWLPVSMKKAGGYRCQTCGTII